MHRPCQKIRRELVVEGILPSESWHNWHFATFDCECFMDDVHTETGVRSIHRLVSIAVKSSFGTNGEHYLERENMDPWSVKTLVQEFLSTLVHMRGEMFKHIPKSVIDGRKHYLKIVTSEGFRKRSVEQQAVARNKLRFLDKCLALRIYSWNGERYDHNVVWAPMMDIFSNMESFDRFNIIRRGTGIMEFSDEALIFRDFLNMTSPMSLDRFAVSCGVTATEKTTFPYELFRDICTLRTTTEFPSYNLFRSSLVSNKSGFISEIEELVTSNVKKGIWENSATANEFFQIDPPIRFTFDTDRFSIHSDDKARASQIFHTSPKKYFTSKKIFDEKCTSMADYLRLYNLNDVILLDECVKSYAQGFFETWAVNIHEEMSLPGVAQGLAFNFYEEAATPLYTFGKKFTHYNEEIRKQLYGGMTLATRFQIYILVFQQKYLLIDRVSRLVA